MPSNHLILCRSLLLPPSIFPSIRVFSSESVLHIRRPKYWSFSFSISPSNEYSGLISFRIDWLDLLAVQGTLKNLLQHHSSKASILRHSASFMVQLSHPYMTTGKTIGLTTQTFVSKVMSLLFNTLSRFHIAILSRSKCLLILWLHLLSALILDPKKMKSDTVSTFSPSVCHEVVGLDAMILAFWILSFKLAFTHNPMNHSMPGLPVHHQLPEFTQTHVHWVGDAIQPSHPLSSPSPPAFSLSQHQGLFQWVSSLHQVAKVLELQHQSFQWIFRSDFL